MSRKSLLTWLVALCMVSSAVIRILFACLKGTGSGGYVWGQVVLPAAACLLFALQCLISGQRQYYKTAIPVYLLALYLCFYTASRGLRNWNLFLYCFMYLTLATVYAVATAGAIRQFWILLPLYLIPLSMRAVYSRQWINTQFILDSVVNLLPDCLFLTALVLCVFATKVHCDGKYYPTWGDRPDGRRLRSLYPMAQISPYIMVNRSGASNLFTDSIEITNLERYVRQKRKEGYTNMGITHVLVASYVRCVAKFPAMNRFLSGQKVYSRGDDIQICMVVKKNMDLESEDSCIKVHLNPHDTMEDVYRKFNQAVEEVRNTPLDSTFDNTARVLTMIPGVFLKFTVWLLKMMDYFGLLPGFLLEVSPFHGSAFLTSMGSLGIPVIYHHLYDFGNLPFFLAFGCKRRANVVLDDGTMVSRKYMDLKFTLDERVADGYYFAAVFKHMRRLLQHPEVLDQPPETVERDID